jgi:hypothetical protein
MSGGGPSSNHLTSGPIDITWHPGPRLAVIRYTPDTRLVGEDGAVLVNSLSGWIGSEGKPFGVLADATGVRGTNAEYRSAMGVFFKDHRDSAYVALTNMGSVVRIVTDMLRIGTGVQLKAFANESKARAWLGSHGIAA